MNAAVLTLSLLLASPICYHPGIFYPGGNDAVCMDVGAMKGGRAAVLSLGLTGLAGWMGYQTKIEARPVEPRLTGGAVHVQCVAKGGATDLIPDVVCGKPRRPAREAQSRPPQRRATRGSAEPTVDEQVQAIRLGDVLPGGQIGKLNHAANLYERKMIANPEDAKGWSDLAAIYLVRAMAADDPRDFMRAYGAASRALEKDENLLEPRFNKALALEYLFLPEAARVAWEKYLDHDRTSGWAEEARRRLREAESHAGAVIVWKEQKALLWEAALDDEVSRVKAIVDQYRQAAREDAEQRFFGDWGEAVLTGQTAAAADHLDVLKAVGDALAETSGERLVQDSVADIEDALKTGDDLRLNKIAQGARDFRDGYKAYKEGHSDWAADKLTAARKALREARCALAWRADFYLVSNDYVSRKYPETVAGAERLAHQMAPEKVSYRALLGHVHWIKGMSEATLGKTREAVEDLRVSLEHFKLLGENENAANINCRLGEVLMSRGLRNAAWQRIYSALRSTPSLRDPIQAATVYMVAGNAALQEELDDAALIFQEERVRQSLMSTDNELVQVEALTWLARFRHDRGDAAGAQASLEAAERLIPEVEAKQQLRRRADLNMIKGIIIEDKNPTDAAELLTSALPTYEKEKNAVFSLWTLLARGRAYRKAGQDDRAEDDFEAALVQYGKMGESLSTEDLRLALLEETDSVFDEMIDLQADRGDSDRAFAYADRARTHVLPGSASKLWTGLLDETNLLLDSEPQSLPLDEIRRRLPERVTLVQFSILSDRVLIWTLRRSGKNERFVQKTIRREDLEDQVARLQNFESKDWDQTARDLFDLLVRPWIFAVPAGEKIVLIPDKVLHRVPFDALKNGDTWLIQTHSVVVAPSATLYVNALGRRYSKPLDLSRGLVVGEPEINQKVRGNESLVSLREAKKEARRLSDLTKAPLLEGAGATKAAFLAAAPQAEWIQFSGHAVIDPANTLLSRLVLASVKNGDHFDNGALTAREIYALKLSGTRFVVLAACDTGNQYVPGGEGVTSLARAFLAAGVPTVVASLWSVDDEATARLFKFFHDNFVKGADPVEALRTAQLEMLKSDDPKDRLPSAWAAFEVIGASADVQP